MENEIEVYDVFINKLKDCRSLVPIAKKSGIPVTTIYAWRNGTVYPTVNNMQKVLDAMGLELSINKKRK